MFEKHEINKYMEKQELITELSKIKEKLLCRKKASLLEMGYHESDELGLYSIVSETSECTSTSSTSGSEPIPREFSLSVTSSSTAERTQRSAA